MNVHLFHDEVGVHQVKDASGWTKMVELSTRPMLSAPPTGYTIHERQRAGISEFQKRRNNFRKLKQMYDDMLDPVYDAEMHANSHSIGKGPSTIIQTRPLGGV